jgi:hypothetical protein
LIFAPPEKREEFDTMLNAPLETDTSTAKYKFSDEASADSFLAALNQKPT